MMKIVLLLSLVVAVYCFPADSKSKLMDLKQSVNKRSVPLERKPLSKRSTYDTFTNNDLDLNHKLDQIEMAYFFYRLGFPADEADKLGTDLLLLADLNNDLNLSRWEWQRNDDVAKGYGLYY